MISSLSRILLLFLLCLPAFFLNAQSDPSKPHGVRPSVGLVLSGGGVKSFAYVGLLRVFPDDLSQVLRCYLMTDSFFVRT